MDSSTLPDIRIAKPIKKPWLVGSKTVIVIDKTLVDRLGIDENNTSFQEEILEGGIFLRLVRTNQDQGK
jgi:hypothetical protein